MSAVQDFHRYLGECPLVAVIRGVTPAEIEDIGEAIFSSGIRILEIPLNSPDPLESIRRLATLLDGRALVGAGTVLQVEEVVAVKEAGGRIIVSPSTDSDVIRASAEAGLVSCPGYFTPSEGFTALAAGAHGLKLFPAEATTPAMVRAQKAVLPDDVPLLVVGGIKPELMKDWLDAGADGFGLGSNLYKPAQSPEETATKARAYVEGLRGR